MGSNVYIEQPRYIAHVEPPACHVASLQEGPRFVAEVTGPASFAVVARGIVMLPGASSINDIAGLGEALAGKQPVGSYAAASHGHPISDVTGLGEALAGKQAVIPALATTARLALPGTLPVGQRDVLVWDTIWQCYFRYVEATASWQQVSVPRHDNTTMNSLPNPEAGYRVWNTTLNQDYIFTSEWQSELKSQSWIRTGGSLSLSANDWVELTAFTCSPGTYIIFSSITGFSVATGAPLYQVRFLVNNVVRSEKYQQNANNAARDFTISDVVPIALSSLAIVSCEVRCSQTASIRNQSSIVIIKG